MRRFWKVGWTSSALAAWAIRLPVFSSRLQFGYFAQALNRHLIAEKRGEALSLAGCREGTVSSRAESCSPEDRVLAPGSRTGVSAPPGKTNAQPESRVHTRSVGHR